MPFKKRKPNNIIKDSMEKFDLFGHPISLNIDGFSDSYKTTNGTFFSIMVYGLYILYLNIIVQNILDGSNTQILEYHSVNVGNEPMNYTNQSSLTTFFIIGKRSG